MTQILLSYFARNASKPMDAETISLYFLSLGYNRNQTAGVIGSFIRRGYIKVVGQTFCKSRQKMVNVFA